MSQEVGFQMAVLVRHAMTEQPASLSPERTAADAAGLMMRHDVGSIPIVDGDRIVGIVTDRDLVVRVMASHRDAGAISLDEIATRDVYTVSPDVELHEARDAMESHRVRRLAVVKDGSLVGMLSLGDVAVALASKRMVGEALERISDSPRTRTRNDGPVVGTPERARPGGGRSGLTE
ncbi:MAG TPA: CBS domain-containing protein [Actinomycetota bacterium]|jgi:CBS domain-containing protein